MWSQRVESTRRSTAHGPHAKCSACEGSVLRALAEVLHMSRMLRMSSKWQLNRLEEFSWNMNKSVPSNTSLYCYCVNLNPVILTFAYFGTRFRIKHSFLKYTSYTCVAFINTLRFKFLYLLTKRAELLLTLYFISEHDGINNNKKENVYLEQQMHNLFINNIYRKPLYYIKYY